MVAGLRNPHRFELTLEGFPVDTVVRHLRPHLGVEGFGKCVVRRCECFPQQGALVRKGKCLIRVFAN
jgi:hypothetical protein